MDSQVAQARRKVCWNGFGTENRLNKVCWNTFGFENRSNKVCGNGFTSSNRLSQYRLAKEIGVPAQRIGEIVAGKRAITADTDLRICRFFGLSNGYWLRAQAAYDTEVAAERLADVLRGICPWKDIVDNTTA